MIATRRTIMKTLLTTPLLASVAQAPATLPDKASFPFEGTFLDAAFTHPLPLAARKAGEDYLATRAQQPTHRWPMRNPRNEAVAAFAALIHAQPAEIAVVPSTLEGENLIVQSCGVSPRNGVVSDAFHYDGSLALYAELARQGVPVTVVAPRKNRIPLEDLDAAITKQTRLVAVSAVSSQTGYQHDLKALCDLAHSKGAMVYADIIQAAGAIPIDVKATGVDFCCSGSYKWLMGDFGTAFLYVRPDRLEHLHRIQTGWRSLAASAHHVYPFDPPGPALGTYTLGNDTAHLFEVSSPDWQALNITLASMTYIRTLGVDRIADYRQPMIARLQNALPRLGFQPLTPPESTGPTVTFAYQGVQEKFAARLQAANITVSLYKNMIRISPSLYNDLNDIDHLLATMA